MLEILKSLITKAIMVYLQRKIPKLKQKSQKIIDKINKYETKIKQELDEDDFYE